MAMPMRKMFALVVLKLQLASTFSIAGTYTLCSTAASTWLPSGCCIASEVTGWTCVNAGVTLQYSDCEGGAPLDAPSLSGCMSYAFKADAAMATVHAGKGKVWWYTAATTFPPCQSHGNTTVNFSVSHAT